MGFFVLLKYSIFSAGRQRISFVDDTTKSMKPIICGWKLHKEKKIPCAELFEHTFNKRRNREKTQVRLNSMKEDISINFLQKVLYQKQAGSNSSKATDAKKKFSSKAYLTQLTACNSSSTLHMIIPWLINVVRRRRTLLAVY